MAYHVVFSFSPFGFIEGVLVIGQLRSSFYFLYITCFTASRVLLTFGKVASIYVGE